VATAARSSPVASLPSSKYRKFTSGGSRGSAVRSVTWPAVLRVWAFRIAHVKIRGSSVTFREYPGW
jgi:hypothetical protein